MKKEQFRYIRIYLFLLPGLLVVSCADQLNLESPQAISAETALSSDKGVKTALIGAYTALGDIFWRGRTVITQELLGNDGDQIVGPFGDIEEVFQKNLTEGNGYTGSIWVRGYDCLNRCNNVLASLEVVKEQDRARVEGEARFIRAAVLFEFVNLYGKTWVDGNPDGNLGVPLPLTPTRRIDEDLLYPRSTVAEVYEVLIADLLFARDNLPEVNDALATTYAASGLLSRVFLMQEAFALARAEAARIINSDRFILLEDFSSAFNQSADTPEDIFAMQNDFQRGSFELINVYAGRNQGGDGIILITDTHLERYESGDLRQTFFYLDNFGARRTAKWMQNASADGNINIMRLAEMYLTRAECHFRLGDPEAAAADLNTVRTRAGLDSLTVEELNLEAILKERDLELAFEGHAFRDAKRNRKNIGDIPFDADQLILPIPLWEMDINPNLVQNLGY